MGSLFRKHTKHQRESASISDKKEGDVYSNFKEFLVVAAAEKRGEEK